MIQYAGFLKWLMVKEKVRARFQVRVRAQARECTTFYFPLGSNVVNVFCWSGSLLWIFNKIMLLQHGPQ